MYYFCENDWTSQIIETSKYPIMKGYSGPWSSVSAPHNTIEELILKNNILKCECNICGRMITAKYVDYINNQLILSNICYYCNFWKQKHLSPDLRRVIIDGEMYVIGNELQNRGFRGYGGYEFIIRIGDMTINTTNLWHNGKIPYHFREVFPNTGEFIKR